MAVLTEPRTAAGRAGAGGGPVLVVNAGSSSLKLRLLDPSDRVVWSEDPSPGDDVVDAVRRGGAAAGAQGGLAGVGHRFVHGGRRFTAPVEATAEVADALEKLTPLAPLHQPAALAGLAAAREALPDARQVACFDTAFHATIPAPAATYALPAQWRERHGLRRFGFHGLSHAYATRRGAEVAGLADRPGTRLVSCHLGAGASLAAVRGGVCVDTTMGFTPMEGLVMATRSGSVDPGLLLWLQTEAGLDAAEVNDALDRRSGLLALAGTADMRAVVDGAAGGDDRCALALEVYLHRLRSLVAAMVAALNGLDVLVFTGGVGERSAAVRAGAAAGLGFLGVAVDAAANAAASAPGGQPDADVSAPGAAVRTVVVEAREDVEVARAVRAGPGDPTKITTSGTRGGPEAG